VLRFVRIEATKDISTKADCNGLATFTGAG
jgi:hypothetical protein